MSRIVILGDLGATGFGTVTLDLGRALLARGEDVRFVSLNKAASLPDEFAGRVINVGTTDGWIGTPKNPEEAELIMRRMDSLFREIDGWSPEAAIIIGDHASVDFSDILRFVPEGFPAFHYVPIEGVGLKPAHANIWAKMRPVAMSEFGADQIATIYPERPPVVYHGVDTTVFHPATPRTPITIRTKGGLAILQSRDDCKRFLGAMLTVTDTDTGKQWPLWQPGRIALFRHDANVPRKRWQSLFRSIAPVLAANPDTDLIYHTRTVYQGGDLEIEKSGYPIELRRRMLSTGLHDAGVRADRNLLVAMLNASDVYVSGAAEGFGLCIAEALACGVPAVGMDYSSVPEVIGKAGILVPPAGLIDNIYSYFWAGVREDLFTEAVARLAGSRRLRRELGALGTIHVGAMFQWSRAAEQFSGLIDGALEGGSGGMTLTVSATEVREYLQFDTDAVSIAASSIPTSQIESNILAAQETLERATRRWFVDRPATTYTATSMLRAIVQIPGFRSFTSITAYSTGTTLVVNQSVWPLPDAQNTGVYVGLQFRPFRADERPWWYADPQWWDKALDNPFYPGNYGGGYAWTSMPNDLVIVGDGGYAAGTYPFSWLLAVKQLASFYTKQPASILANTIITAQGGIINYAELPSTVTAFIASWTAGTQAVSLG